MNPFVLIMLCAMGAPEMDAPSEKPLFRPELFEIGPGCSWRVSHGPTLSMNEWFIAGPGPGVHREEWLRDARVFREQARGGLEHTLEMDAARGDAWLRPEKDVSSAMQLVPGDELYLLLRVRRLAGNKAALVVTFENGAEEQEESLLPLPDDDAWHDLETVIMAPARKSADAVLRPVAQLRCEGADGPARIEIAGCIMGVADTERMAAVSRIVHENGVGHSCRCIYEREDLRWTVASHTHYFLFMYDKSFYDPEHGYRVDAFLDDKERRFGGVDAVLLWPAYPRLGIDDRNQFDFFRDMPGGIEGLRTVCHRFQERGVRVMLPYLPWDKETRREGASDEDMMAMLVRELDGDGIFLDTLTDAAPALRRAVDAARPGVALAPELCPPVAQISMSSFSWAQWPHDPDPPGMPLLRWIEPRHVQHYTRRWDRRHQWEMETAFFNGTGMLLWENIFGSYNPYSSEDALFWKRCAAILRAFPDEFSSTLWDPYYPSLQEDLFIHRWPGAPTTLFTLRNTGAPIEHGRLLRWQLPPHVRADNMQVFDLWNGRRARWDMSEFGWVYLWGDVDALGCIAVVFGDDPRIEALLETQAALAAVEAVGISAPTLKSAATTAPVAATAPPEGMALVSGGMTPMRIAHQRRECGCYPDPGSDDKDFLWGHPHDETIVHDYAVELASFFMDEAQVSNGAFKQFLDETGYTPAHPQNFLKHWPGGVMPEALADLPVVYVDLDDARAYAQWAGKRLPTEPEWQRAAQGEDGRRWPWGDEFDPEKCPPAGDKPLPVRALPESRSPYGCYLMAGNVWEWTESERDDGHTRFCIIRGGSHYHISGSGWYAPTGPQPLDTHTKFLLMWPGLDRCATIGFRCVKDVR